VLDVVPVVVVVPMMDLVVRWLGKGRIGEQEQHGGRRRNGYLIHEITSCFELVCEVCNTRVVKPMTFVSC